MCGRYTLYEAEGLSDRFNLATRPSVRVADSYNVAPGQAMPIIVKGDTGNQLELMRWGLVPAWSKDPKIGFKLINARAESCFIKPTWRQYIYTSRCLVPARGFYEWKALEGAKTKQAFYIHPKGGEIISFAGLWTSFKSADGYETKTFSIITTSSNKEMSTVHKRMPVILNQSKENDWLKPSLDKAGIAALLESYEGVLEIYKVGPDVNSALHTGEQLIRRV
jgi:putative SOS response-associated peptidase YedK